MELSYFIYNVIVNDNVRGFHVLIYICIFVKLV